MVKRSSRFGSLVTFVVLLWCGSHTPVATAADRPNIVFILTDDQGYQDLGCYGSPLIKTPHVDRMAAEGMRFTDFYSASPLCTPARAALLTGCYPMRVSMNDFPIGKGQSDAKSSHVLYPNSPIGLNPDEVTIPDVLKTAGYATAIVGKWHLGDAKPLLPLHQGFDSFFGLSYVNDQKPLFYLRGDDKADVPFDMDHITQVYTREAIDVIRKNKDRPFFLYLAHTMPHWPLGASENFKGKSKAGLYGDVVEEIDWSVGQIFETLAELGLEKNTLVVFTSDNGPWLQKGEDGGNAVPFRGGKGTTYEGGMRVPCVVWWPGHVPPGTVCHSMTTMMDWLPTFASITGTSASIPPNRPIDGKDISAILRDPAAPGPDEFLLYYADENLLAGVRSGKWKLKLETSMREEAHYGKLEHPDDKVPAKLFNLDLDPAEQKSVAKEHPDVVKRLEKYVEWAREELGDARVGKVGKHVRPIGRVGD